MSSRIVRLVIVPAVLVSGVAGVTFALARAHPAKPDEPGGTMAIVSSVTGASARGELVFAARCATCHGVAGTGGGVGPRLAGSGVSREDARATIENGSGAMPADLVEGPELEDVLAYLQTIATAR